MRVWCLLILVACGEAPCPSHEDVRIPGDRERAEEIRSAMLDFESWTGKRACVREVEIGTRRLWWPDGFAIPPEVDNPRWTVFHRMCSLLDLAEGYSAREPEIFNGVGIDEHGWTTQELRNREDLARTCAHWNDPLTAWLQPALEACGELPSPEAAFITELFADFPERMPLAPTEEVLLGTVEGMDDGAELASVGDVLYAAQEVWVEDHRELHIRALDLDGLTPRWSVEREPMGGSFRLFAGLHGALWWSGDGIAVLTPEGMGASTPVPELSSLSCAEDSEGWWCSGSDKSLYRFDEADGLMPTGRPGNGKLHSDPEHHWYQDGHRVVQHNTGIVVSSPGFSGVSTRSGGHWFSSVAVGRHRVWLRREADGSWVHERALCDRESFVLPVSGTHRRIGRTYGRSYWWPLMIYETVSE